MLTVRYFAAARAAAGTAEEAVPGTRSITAVLDELAGRHGERLAAVLTRCSFLLDGRQVHRGADPQLPDDGVLDVLPPFAGG